MFRYLLVAKCEAVSPALEAEVKIEESSVVLKPHKDLNVKTEVKIEDSGILLKPKLEIAKSAAQIIHEQRGKYVTHVL